MPANPNEVREALDAVQRLMTTPLPGPRQRQEMLTQVYKTLRRMMQDEEQMEHEEGQDRPEVDLEDDPLLGKILER